MAQVSTPLWYCCKLLSRDACVQCFWMPPPVCHIGSLKLPSWEMEIGNWQTVQIQVGFGFERWLFSVHFSRPVVSDSLWPHGLQHTKLSITNPWRLYKFMSIASVMPSNHLILCHPLLFLQSFPASGAFPVSSSHQVVKVLEFQLQHQSFQWTPRTDLL